MKKINNPSKKNIRSNFDQGMTCMPHAFPGFDRSTYVSVKSKPDRPPSPVNFLMGEFPTPGQKWSSKPPPPRAFKNELRPHPRAFFSIINYKNVKK